MPEINIPKQLQNVRFRFIKLLKEEKKAIEKGWQEYANYTYSQIELVKWLIAGGNYGVVGGFGDLVIIDSDAIEVEKAIKEYLPKTFTVRTLHGLHNYFICRDMKKPIRLTEKTGGDWGDVQSKGKYVVGPNCIHPSGKVYEVEDDVPIAEVSSSQIKFALRAFLPLKDIEILNQEQQGGVNIPMEKVVNLAELRNRGSEYYGSHPVHGSQGGMNFWVNTEKNVWHCFRHDSGGGALSWIAVKEGLINCSKAGKRIIHGKLFEEVAKIAREKYNIIIESRMGKEKKYFEGRDFISKRLGDELLGSYIIKTTNADETIYHYENGIYKDNGETILKEAAIKLLGESSKEYYINEIIFYIKNSTISAGMNEEKHLINLKNGIFNMQTMQLEEHSPEKFLTVQIPIAYIDGAECPKIKKFLFEIMCEDDVKRIQELFGYCLLREYPIHKAFLFIGDGANGKSTLINLIKEFLSNENVSSVPLQDFDTNRFSSARLYNKLANLYPDLPDKALYNTGRFKMVTGGDIIAAEKKFKDTFNFVNYAKLVFSCNNVPESKDESGAFFRRWIFINFPNKFEGKECNPNMLKELTTEEEMSGLFNWAIEGLKRLLENQEFSFSKTTEEMKDIYERLSSSTKAFCKDELEFESENIIEKDIMYARYVEYCKKHNLPSTANNVFARELKGALGEHIREVRVRKEGRRIYCWEGCVFKNEPESIKTKEDYEVLS